MTNRSMTVIKKMECQIIKDSVYEWINGLDPSKRFNRVPRKDSPSRSLTVGHCAGTFFLPVKRLSLAPPKMRFESQVLGRFFNPGINGVTNRKTEMIIRTQEIGLVRKMEKSPCDMIRDWRRAFSSIGLRTKARIRGAPS